MPQPAATCAWPRLTCCGWQVPGGSAGEFLLGVVCRKSNRIEPAVAHFRKALALDPFCWSAFEELCALGDDTEAASLLKSAKCGALRCPFAPRALTRPLRHCSPDALYPATAVAGGGQLESSSFVTPDAALEFLRAGPVGTPAAPMASLVSPPVARCVHAHAFVAGRIVMCPCRATAQPRSVVHTPRPMDLMQADAETIGADAATPASFVTPSPGASGAGSVPPPAAAKLQGAPRGVPQVSAAADTTDPGELRLRSALAPVWSPASPPQAGWQRRARVSDGSRLTKANFARCDCFFLALRCASTTDLLTSGDKVTGRLFTDVPAQSLRRSSRLSCHPTGPLEVRGAWSCCGLPKLIIYLLQSTPTPGPRGRGTAFDTGYSRGQLLGEAAQRGWCVSA